MVKTTTIVVHSDTRDNLIALKQHPRESLNDVITRLVHNATD